jgi:GxxExxY protein
MDENALSKLINGAAIEVHRQLEPGLLESAYEECTAYEYSLREIPFVPLMRHGIKRLALNL